MATRGAIWIPSDWGVIWNIGIKSDADPARMKPLIGWMTQHRVLDMAKNSKDPEWDGIGPPRRHELSRGLPHAAADTLDYVWVYSSRLQEWVNWRDNADEFQAVISQIKAAYRGGKERHERLREADPMNESAEGRDGDLRTIHKIREQIVTGMSSMGEKGGANIGDIAEAVSNKGFEGLTPSEIHLLFAFMKGAKDACDSWERNIDLLRDYFDSLLPG